MLLSLELGGKNPMIVLSDADPGRARSGAAWAGYQNAGQSCGGVKRIYVHESVYAVLWICSLRKQRRCPTAPTQGMASIRER